MKSKWPYGYQFNYFARSDYILLTCPYWNKEKMYQCLKKFFCNKVWLISAQMDFWLLKHINKWMNAKHRRPWEIVSQILVFNFSSFIYTFSPFSHWYSRRETPRQYISRCNNSSSLPIKILRSESFQVKSWNFKPTIVVR
jgi:hypothetical protein